MHQYVQAFKKGKGKGHPITGHEGPEGEQMYSYTLPWTSALDRGVGGQRHDAPGKDPVPFVQEAGRVRNISPAHIGIRSPDRPSRSELLYRLGYPGPTGPLGISKQLWTCLHIHFVINSGLFVLNWGCVSSVTSVCDTWRVDCQLQSCLYQFIAGYMFRFCENYNQAIKNI